VIGVNLLSEVFVSRRDYGGADVVRTKQRVGTRRGLLRPEPVWLISSRLWKVLRATGIRGAGVEVAHLVDGLSREE